MKNKISRILCTALCCAPLLATAQTSEKITSPQRLYQEGQSLFQQKAYAAAIPPLQAFVRQVDAEGKPLPAEGERMEAEYMLVCAAYELKDTKSIDKLRAYLDEYPDTPYANRIYALMASVYFFEGNYDAAMAMFNASRLDLLGNEERDDMTYRLATCYLKTGNVKEAAIWFETLRSTSKKYVADCTYYLSYIRYTQQRYDDALTGFLSLQDNEKYKALAPYYIAEIYLIKKNYDKAEIVAQNYLSAYPNNEYTAEMYRVLGDADYHFGKYHEAMGAFEKYLANNKEEAPRRDALYMLGLSYYHSGVYTKAANTLGEVATGMMRFHRIPICTWACRTCKWETKTKRVWHLNRLPPLMQTCRSRSRPHTTMPSVFTKLLIPLSVNLSPFSKSSSMNSPIPSMWIKSAVIW